LTPFERLIPKWKASPSHCQSDEYHQKRMRKAVAYLRLSKATLFRAIAAGKLRRFKVGARTLLRRRDVETLIREA